MKQDVMRQSDAAPVGHPAGKPPNDDLSRTVYLVLGIPIDAVDMAGAVRKIEDAAAARTPLLVSTVNLNFLVASQQDDEFRQSLLASDLCIADGMPLLWMARLLGVPIRHRLTGADLLQALKNPGTSGRRFSVVWFGGQSGVAERACRRINAEAGRLTCSGAICPGFGSIEEMSSEAHIDAVNASKADFLAVALGARKGQAWLRRNHARIQVPVRSHLGAAVNFQAGTLRRAPAAWQTLGLEWLWRIKEEPQLASRYWHDGIALLRLLATRILPLALVMGWSRLRRAGEGCTCERRRDGAATRLVMSGTVWPRDGDKLRTAFRQAVAEEKPVILDLAGLNHADPLFFGLVLMLGKQLQSAGLDLTIENTTESLERMMRLSCLDRALL